MVRHSLKFAALSLMMCLAAVSADPPRVDATESGAALVTYHGKKFHIKEPRQVGIDGIQIGDEKTVGWLILYKVGGVSYPVPGMLVIWRDGKIVRGFSPAGSFYSWTFYHDAEQVAYHTGPLHSERRSHCELRDIATGRLFSSWDGDLESDDRPEWAGFLDR
jgi:hypothetical protein